MPAKKEMRNAKAITMKNGKKTRIASVATVLLGVVLVLTSCTSAAPVPPAASPPPKELVKEVPVEEQHPLAGKTVWVVSALDNFLMPMVAELLPRYAPGVKVRSIIAAQDTGNPFTLLRPGDYPDGVIIGIGQCPATTPLVVYYARQAESKGIPSVICYTSAMRDLKEELANIYKISDIPGYEVEGALPVNQEEAESVARTLLPLFIEALTKSVAGY